MRTLMLIGVLVAGVVGASTLMRPQSDELTLPDCKREVADGLRSGAFLSDYGLATHLSATETDPAVGEICQALLRRQQPTHNESVQKWIARIRLQQPELLLPLCQPMVEADLARHAHLLRFMTSNERNRFRTEHCRLADRYMAKFRTPPEVTAARMTAENAEIYIPHCASLARHGMEKSWPSLTPAQLQLIARRTCAKALTTGTATYGIPPVVDRSFDGDGWGEIAAAVAREVVFAAPQE